MADTALRVIVLTYKAPAERTVKHVSIMGSWDNMKKHRMSPSPRGTDLWEMPKFLLPGTYHFCFEVDGVLTYDPTQPIQPAGSFSMLNPWTNTYNELVVSEVKLLSVKHARTGHSVEFAYELSVGMDENWKRAKECMSITEPGMFVLKNCLAITSPAQLDLIRKVYFMPTQTPLDAGNSNLSPSTTPPSSPLFEPTQRLYHVIASKADQPLHTANSMEDAQAWASTNFQGGQLYIRADPPETLKTTRLWQTTMR